MPVPQTLTSGAFGLATKASASSMQTLRFPWPAPSPRTAWPSMYAFWLMSNLVFFTKALEAPQKRQVRTITHAFILQKVDNVQINALTGVLGLES